MPVHHALIDILRMGGTETWKASYFTLVWAAPLHIQWYRTAADLPMQFLPVRSTSKPSLQAHLYVLSMFSHTPFWQMSGSRAHSLISEKTHSDLGTSPREINLDRSSCFSPNLITDDELLFSTSSITSYPPTIGAQSQVLSWGKKNTEFIRKEKT